MDACVYKDALLNGLDIPEGKYYLADAGFLCCEELLIPYHGRWYHLAEWSCWAQVSFSFPPILKLPLISITAQ